MLVRFAQRNASWEVEPEEFANTEFRADDHDWDRALSVFMVPLDQFVRLCAEHGAELKLNGKRREGFGLPPRDLKLHSSPPETRFEPPGIFSMRIQGHREIILSTEDDFIALARKVMDAFKADPTNWREAPRAKQREYSVAQWQEGNPEWRAFSDACLGDDDKGDALRKEWCGIPMGSAT